MQAISFSAQTYAYRVHSNYFAYYQHSYIASIHYRRFSEAEKLASYLGLVPGEDSSGGKQNRLGITKAGNSQVRRLLVEAAQGYTRGQIGHKSADLKRRQNGNTPQVIAYADKANERLRRKFYRMTLKNNTNRNIAATAIARELACFR